MLSMTGYKIMRTNNNYHRHGERSAAESNHLFNIKEMALQACNDGPVGCHDLIDLSEPIF